MQGQRNKAILVFETAGRVDVEFIVGHVGSPGPDFYRHRTEN